MTMNTEPKTVLVADDDATIRTVVTTALEREGFKVIAVGRAADLWDLVECGEGDIIVTDIVMPDENGLQLIPRIKDSRPGLPVIVMSAQNTLATAVKARAVGAYEYLPKPFNINELQDAVRKGCEEVVATETSGGFEDSELPLIGRSKAMQNVYRIIARVVATELTVLITGESGTGKELVARALHDMGPRKTGPFIAVNMAAIPSELIESELFGHERGAFTGATSRSPGKFEQAQGGTLFLDEIGDMPVGAQTRLLRVLQEGEFTPVGGHGAKKTDVRIVAASNQDIETLVKKGKFREDLFFRINVIPLHLPALRERQTDIPLLIRHFQVLGARNGLPQKVYRDDAIKALQRYIWPGNVRELENLIHRIAALYSDDAVSAKIINKELKGHSKTPPVGAPDKGEGLMEAVEFHIQRYFEAHDGALPPEGVYDRALRAFERPVIVACLQATHGNQMRAAQLLGMNRNTLRKKMQILGIHVTKGAL